MKPSRSETNGYEHNFFRVDRDALDKEYIEHPRDYHVAACNYADAEEAFEQAKAAKEVYEHELEKVVAELDQSIRKTPSKYGFEAKPTEKAIEMSILLQAEYDKAKRRVFKAQQEIISTKHAMGIYKADVNAFDHKGKSIGGIASLDARDYYSSPKIPDKTGKEAMKRVERDAAFDRRKKT